MPRYDHIFVIVEENKGYRLIMDHPDWTPVIHRLAAEYSEATQFYAEVHSSEATISRCWAAIRSASMTTTHSIATKA